MKLSYIALNHRPILLAVRTCFLTCAGGLTVTFAKEFLT